MQMRCVVPTYVAAVCENRGQGLSILCNDGLSFKIGEIGVDTFHLKALALAKTMKLTKRDSVQHQECKNRTDCFLEDLLLVDPSRIRLT